MTNIYDRAHELARALAQSQEYKRFAEVKTRVEANEEHKKLLQDFRKKQLELQKVYVEQGKVPDDQVKQLEQLQGILMQNPTLGEFLQAEYFFSKVMVDIQKIIGEAVGIEMPEGLK